MKTHFYFLGAFLVSCPLSGFAALDTYGQTVVTTSSLQLMEANKALDSYQQPVAHPTVPVASAEPTDTYGQKPHEPTPEAVKPKRISYQDFFGGDSFLKQNLDPRHTHTLQAGVEPYYSYYVEPDISVYNRGMMLGYYVNYAFRPSEGNILNNAIINTYMVEWRWATGELDYKGSGVMNDKRNQNHEIRGLLGKDYLLTDNVLITPYVGFGYRYLLDEGSARLTSTNFYGYDRHSTYWYVPVGVTIKIPSSTPWSTEFNAEYDIFIEGLQVSDLSASSYFNVGVSNPNVHNEQTSGFGVRGSFKLIYSSPRFNFYVEPFVRFWNIEDSEVTTATVDGTTGGFYEPQNTTFEAGSKVGLQF